MVNNAVDIVDVRINGAYQIRLPKHRADRPEWYTEAGWEKKRLDALRGFIRKGDTVFYVGSEEGEMPALCQMWGAEVFMFEPNPLVWPNTKAIWRANNLKPPLGTFSGFAANTTDPKVEVLLNRFPDSANGEVIGNHGFKELAYEADSFAKIKIDDLVEQTKIIPTIITMDVEGSEFEVLKGAEQVLNRYHPTLFISWHPEFMFRMFNTYVADARKWLTSLQYREVLIDYPLHEVHMMYDY